MRTHSYEVLLKSFRHHPELAADLLAGPLGCHVPEFDRARWWSGDKADADADRPSYLPEAAVTFTLSGDEVFAVAVELQRDVDWWKRRLWPARVATLHVMTDCPVRLLVMCPDPEVAAWCAEPIVIAETALTLVPTVLGPHVPLAEFMAATTRKYGTWPPNRFHSFAKVSGMAEALMIGLEARSIEIPEDVHVEIMDCGDLNRLRAWVRRAATADTIEDVFSAREPIY